MSKKNIGTSSSSSQSEEKKKNELVVNKKEQVEEEQIDTLGLLGELNTTIELFYKQCCLFWKNYKNNFIKWWENLNNNEKYNFIKLISPDMKEEPPLDKLDFEFTDYILPEFYLKNLSNLNDKLNTNKLNKNDNLNTSELNKNLSLIDFIDLFCNDEIFNLNKLYEIEYKRLHQLRSINKIFSKLFTLPYEAFTLYNNNKIYKIKKNPTEQEMKEWIALSTMCDANTYFLVFQRLSFIYTHFGLLMEVFLEQEGNEELKLKFNELLLEKK
ncbi:hypothetical protein ABK040_015376 [Willaertia magna]